MADTPTPLSPAEIEELDAMERALEQDDDLFHQLYQRTEHEWDRWYLLKDHADRVAACLCLYRAELAAWHEIRQENGPCAAGEPCPA